MTTPREGENAAAPGARGRPAAGERADAAARDGEAPRARVRVLFFGAARELAADEATLEVPTPATARAVFELVLAEYPSLRRFGRTLLVAVNQEYARDLDAEVRDGDELAFFPPVSGGADEAAPPTPDDARDFFELTTGPIAVGGVARRVVPPRCGATVTLDGYAREWTRGRRTLYLVYEAYAPMALAEMRRLGAEARRRFDIAHVGIVHRTGRTDIGETSVVISVSAPHRRAAFEACEWAIRELKRTVPIWKKEFFEDGSVWVEGEGAPEQTRGGGQRVALLMAKGISKTRIDRLGDRLKRGNITEDDLRLLDQYRRSFTEAYEIVVGAIREKLALEPTGRPAKSTTSISDKLRRESIRLTQIQDIAGCRLIVPDITNQDSVVQSLSQLFEHTIIIDRRQQPSHGYRAVHVVVGCRGKLIEVQVRTLLQQLWAELSEKLSDVEDPTIKYGGGDEATRAFLIKASEIVALNESVDMKLAALLAGATSRGIVPDDAIAERHESTERTLQMLRHFIDQMSELEGGDDAVPD